MLGDLYSLSALCQKLYSEFGFKPLIVLLLGDLLHLGNWKVEKNRMQEQDQDQAGEQDEKQEQQEESLC